MPTESKPRRRPARQPQDHLPAKSDAPETEEIDPELQALIDQENLNIQLVQQQALIAHLQGRIVTLQKEILALRKKASK